jgi:hypothetical protein
MNLKQLNSAGQITPIANAYRSPTQVQDSELVKKKLMEKSLE